VYNGEQFSSKFNELGLVTYGVNDEYSYFKGVDNENSFTALISYGEYVGEEQIGEAEILNWTAQILNIYVYKHSKLDWNSPDYNNWRDFAIDDGYRLLWIDSDFESFGYSVEAD